MGSFGERLQREREMRGITLEEISEATKIGTRALRALEEQDFEKLPGGIFNKGFVRAYSRYLGINEEQAVADYVNAVNERMAERAASAGNEEPEKTTVIADEQPQPLPKIAWQPILLLLLMVALVVAGWRYLAKHGVPKFGRSKPAPTSQTPPPRIPTPAAPTPAMLQAIPAGKTGAAAGKGAASSSAEKPATPKRGAGEAAAKNAAQSPVAGNNPIGTTPAAMTEEKPFSVRVHATSESWVSITADGKLVMEGILAADGEKTVRAERSVVLKTGNAGGVEVFHNDKPLPTLGEANQVKTVTLTADGVRN